MHLGAARTPEVTSPFRPLLHQLLRLASLQVSRWGWEQHCSQRGTKSWSCRGGLRMQRTDSSLSKGSYASVTSPAS